jgi:hypothetical protein
MHSHNARGNTSFSLSTVPSLYLMSAIVLGLTSLNAVFNSLASSVGLGFPYSTFLFKPWDIFGDFFTVAVSYPGPDFYVQGELAPLFASHPTSGGISNLNTPPLASLIYISVRYAITALSPYAVLAAYIGMWAVPLGLLIFTQCRNRHLSAILLLVLLMSYPTLLAVTRGNVGAGVTAVALIAAMTLTYSKRAPLLVAILIAVAVNMRPNTIVFLLLPFIASQPRVAIKYSTIALAFAASIAAVSFIAVHALYSAYTFSSFSQAIRVYYAVYVIGDWGWAYGSSFFGLVKAVVKYFNVNCDLGSVNKIIALTWGAILLIAATLFERNHIEKRTLLFVLCATYTLASSVFADYHLLVFFGFFLIYAIDGNVEWGSLPRTDKVIQVCVALMLAPKNYLFFNNSVSAQIVLNPLILTIGVALVMLHSRQRDALAA